MTKLYCVSDLHNEYLRYEVPDNLDCDVLVAAGDTDTDPERAIEFLASIGKPVIVTGGNHDMWSDPEKRGLPHVDFASRIRLLRQLCEGTQVHFLEQDSVVIGDTRFLGTELWVSFMNANKRLMHYAKDSMRDYTLIGAQEWLADPERRAEFLADCKKFGFEWETEDRIKWDTALFHPVLAYRLHQGAKDWLGDELSKHGTWKHNVVVTHMAPTYLSLTRSGFVKEKNLDPKTWPEGRLDMRWDEAAIYRIASYASPMHDFLRDYQESISLWVHGHIHGSVDLSAGGVRVLCNPRGYASSKKNTQSGDNRDFDPCLVIDLETQGGYMSLLKAEIDESITKLHTILDEIKGFGEHLENTDPFLKIAADESYRVRTKAFEEEGNRICQRINDNLKTNTFGGDKALDFPIVGFKAHSTLPMIGDPFDVAFERPPKTLRDVLESAEEFISALRRIPELPIMIAAEAKRKAEDILVALKKKGVQAEYWPSRGMHADSTLHFFVHGAHDAQRRNDLRLLGRDTAHATFTAWDVRLEFEPEDDNEDVRAELAFYKAPQEPEPSAETRIALAYPETTFAQPVDVFYSIDTKWKRVSIRMESGYSTEEVLSYPFLLRAVERIQAEHDIKVIVDDTGSRMRDISDERETHHRLELLLGKKEYRAELIRQLSGEIILELTR